MRRLIVTEDGSHTLYSEAYEEHYHSAHGALQESMHIFIDAGLKTFEPGVINILEVGFGTGLNALLTLIESEKFDRSIHYDAIELYPLEEAEYNLLNYTSGLGHAPEFLTMHQCAWEKPVQISSSFRLRKLLADLSNTEFDRHYDLIYFDAFSPEIQPELWTEYIFQKVAASCNPGAVLTTYSAKGAVRRALEAAGFIVERIPGPPGKREILRARIP